MVTPKTIEEMIFYHERAGGNWFSKENMDFFETKIETPPNRKGLFITSEKNAFGTKRGYTIRLFDRGTYVIETVNEFLQYKTLEEAKEAMKQI